MSPSMHHKVLADRMNYVKGASDGTEDGSVWQQSLRFTGLDAGSTYTVVVKKGEAGEITSNGGCREPEQAGSQCTAPGRS